MSVDSAMQKLLPQIERLTLKRALELQAIAIELHSSAPRGGVNINARGRFRSAPGEQPAPEFGGLMEAIRDTPQKMTDEAGNPGFRTVVNRVYLEKPPMIRIAPRPLGRMAAERLKARR